METLHRNLPYGEASMRLNKNGRLEVHYHREGYVLCFPTRFSSILGAKMGKLKVNLKPGKNYIQVVDRVGSTVVIELTGINRNKSIN